MVHPCHIWLGLPTLMGLTFMLLVVFRVGPDLFLTQIYFWPQISGKFNHVDRSGDRPHKPHGITQDWPGIISGCPRITRDWPRITQDFPRITWNFPGITWDYPGFSWDYPGFSRDLHKFWNYMLDVKKEVGTQENLLWYCKIYKLCIHLNKPLLILHPPGPSQGLLKLTIVTLLLSAQVIPCMKFSPSFPLEHPHCHLIGLNRKVA